MKFNLDRKKKLCKDAGIYVSGSAWREAAHKLCKNPAAMISGIVLAVIFLACLSAPLTGLSYSNLIIEDRYLPPGPGHILGTDSIGRDFFARILYGTRYTMFISFTATFMAAAAGMVIGVLSGYHGGRTDFLTMRLIDLIAAVPSFLLVIVMETALGWGSGKFVYALAIASVPAFARLMRASAMDVMGNDFIEAARALGANHAGIIFRHVTHNISAPLMIQLTGIAAETILFCSVLGYLQIGISPPMPELGNLVHEGLISFWSGHPYIVFFPCLVVMLCVLSLNVLGNGLRDALGKEAADAKK